MNETERSRPRVLIVDDDPFMQEIIGQALTAIGLAVEFCNDGEDALVQIDASPPDLLVLDVELPGKNGFETCAELRQCSVNAELPVIMVTGSSDARRIERAFEAGASDFITKPVDPQLLQHRVRFALRADDAFRRLRLTLSDLLKGEKRLATAQRMASVGSWEWNPDSDQMLWSEEVYRILGMEPHACTASAAALLACAHPDDRAQLDKALGQAAFEGREWSFDHRVVWPGGEERVVFHQAALSEDGTTGEAAILGTLQDITERRQAEEEIRFLSYYDSVTGLPNRRMFGESLSQCLLRARRCGNVVALLFLDLDRFKRINETLGRAAGDELLKAVADRLLRCVRESDHVGSGRRERADSLSRIGADEFTLVLTEIRAPEDAALVAHRVREALSAPFVIGGQEVVMSAAIGIALYPDDATDADAILARANTAMHHAKAEGAGQYRFFSGTMNARALRNLQLESGLRRALERDQLVLNYQPLVSASTGRLTEFECLARWQSEEFGAVAPGEFIPLAEETGLISPLGEQILRRACEQLRRWQNADLPRVPIAVNVSSLQFREQEVFEMVRRALRDFELEPSDLKLELTESALFGDDPRVIEAMRALKDLGVQLALDDFGTGYSSLSYLVRFPIDTIKIDRSFVMNVGNDVQADAMIAAVVAMARRLGLSVTAEGVETDAQREFLGAEGCDTLQGYLLGRPLEAEAAETLLRRLADEDV